MPRTPFQDTLLAAWQGVSESSRDAPRSVPGSTGIATTVSLNMRRPTSRDARKSGMCLGVEPPEPTRSAKVVWARAISRCSAATSVIQCALGQDARYEQAESISLAS